MRRQADRDGVPGESFRGSGIELESSRRRRVTPSDAPQTVLAPELMGIGTATVRARGGGRAALQRPIKRAPGTNAATANQNACRSWRRRSCARRRGPLIARPVMSQREPV